MGLNAELLRQYIQDIADRRLERLRLTKQYGSENPFPWMSEVIDLKKEKTSLKQGSPNIRPSGRWSGEEQE